MDDGTIRTYTVEYDPAVSRRVTNAYIGATWHQWLRAWWSFTLMYSLMGLLFYCIPSFAAKDSDPSLQYVAIVVVAAGIAAAQLLSRIGHAPTQSAKRYAGEVWTCEVTDHAWSFASRKGLKITVPWPLMKLTHAFEDAYIVMYDSSIVTVYRAPLKAAGLDEEFARRAGWQGKI